jgi:hypothetical protein
LNSWSLARFTRKAYPEPLINNRKYKYHHFPFMHEAVLGVATIDKCPISMQKVKPGS